MNKFKPRNPGPPYIFQEPNLLDREKQDRVFEESLREIQFYYAQKEIDRVLEGTLIEIQSSKPDVPIDLKPLEGAAYVEPPQVLLTQVQDFDAIKFVWSIFGEGVLGNIADYSL